MKFAIYLATLISVLGWQVSCDDGKNEMYDFDLSHLDEDFENWVENVTSWADLENGLDAHLPKPLKGNLCRNTTEAIKAEISKCKSKGDFNFKEYIGSLRNSRRSFLEHFYNLGNDKLFDDPDFKTWIRTAKTWKDFENGFVSHLPKHTNISSVTETLCASAATHILDIIKDMKLISLVANPEMWTEEISGWAEQLQHQNISYGMEKSLADTKVRRTRRAQENVKKFK